MQTFVAFPTIFCLHSERSPQEVKGGILAPDTELREGCQALMIIYSNGDSLNKGTATTQCKLALSLKLRGLVTPR